MNKYLTYLIEDCYKEDYNPYIAEYWYDNYCYNQTFCEWYFSHRKILHYDKHTKYKLTPEKLIIGCDIFCFTQLLK
jgi:hypothetical protein